MNAVDRTAGSVQRQEFVARMRPLSWQGNSEMTSTAKKTTTGTTNGNGAEVLKPIEAAVTAGKESVEAVVKAGTDAATKNYEQAIAMTS